MNISIKFIAKRLKDISQATVISVPADTRPTFRTGGIGGDAGRQKLRRSISVLPMMKDRGLGCMQTTEDRQNLLQAVKHSIP